MDRIKLLLLVTKPEIGGAQRYVHSLATHLPRESFEVTVACGENGEWLTSQLKSAGVKVVVLPALIRGISLTQDMRALLQVWRLIRNERFNLVHLNSSKAAIVGRLAAALADVPTVFTVHGWPFSEGVPRSRRMLALLVEKMFAPLTSQIICVSEYDHLLALRHHVAPADRLQVVHNGIEDLSFDRLAEPTYEGPVRIVMVARFAPQKDFETLIRAASLLEGAFELILVGDGPLYDECRALARSLGLAARVRFLGLQENVPEILACTHIAVLSSNWEGLPITILESMRAGLPVVATDVGGIPELVEDKQNGYLVPRCDPEALARALQDLVNAPDVRRQMGAAGRARFEQCFTMDLMLRRTIDVYRGVLQLN